MSASSVTVGSIQVVEGIDDRDPGKHVRDVDPIAERGGRGGELDARVDAFRLTGVIRDVNCNAVPGADEIAHGVGQVQLALCIDGLQPVERGPEQIRPEDVDRGVRLADRELLGRRVGRLDDRLEVAVGATDDSAVAADVARERTRARLRPRPATGASRSALRAARLSGAACRPRGSAPRRRRRAPPGLLGLRPRFRAVVPERRPSARRTISRLGRRDDDQRLGAEWPGRLDDPVDHPPPEDRVQMLGRRRAHACPTASGHDDGCELERDSDTVGTLAGAPGFEPGITGPKPVALPLGHAPVNRDAECTRTPGHTGFGRSALVGVEPYGR